MCDFLLIAADQILDRAETDPGCREAIACFCICPPLPPMPSQDAAVLCAGILIEAHQRITKQRSLQHFLAEPSYHTVVSGDSFNTERISPLAFMARVRRQSRIHGTNHNSERLQ